MREMNKHASVTSIINCEPSPYQHNDQNVYKNIQDQVSTKNVFKGTSDDTI